MSVTGKILIPFLEYKRLIEMEDELRNLKKEFHKKNQVKSMAEVDDNTTTADLMKGHGDNDDDADKGTYQFPLPLKADPMPDQMISGLSVMSKTDPDVTSETESSSANIESEKTGHKFYYLGPLRSLN
jgi:hypothetical protein